jgi:hypothetical protein
MPKEPEIKPLPNTPGKPNLPEIMPQPDKQVTEPKVPEIVPLPKPEIKPEKENLQ